MEARKHLYMAALVPAALLTLAVAATLLLTDGYPDQVLALRWYPLAMCLAVGLVALTLALFRKPSAMLFVVASSCSAASYAVPMTAMVVAPALAYKAGGHATGRNPVRAEQGWGWQSSVIRDSEGETLSIRDAWLFSGWNFDASTASWQRFSGTPINRELRLDVHTEFCLIGIVVGVLGAMWACRRDRPKLSS